MQSSKPRDGGNNKVEIEFQIEDPKADRHWTEAKHLEILRMIVPGVGFVR